jgi:zinc transport system permease protein
MIEWLDQVLNGIAGLFPASTWMSASYNVRAFAALVLVSVICGAVGSLVVGNRMAFFSDALAHCAFAGVTLGLIVALATGQGQDSWLIPVVMVISGVAFGIGIAFVRERTGLANDTVIGVFFAFAVGFGGMLFTSLQRRTLNPESFLFGNPLAASAQDILILLILAVFVVVVLSGRYNHFVLTSFSPSLARSRQIPVRLSNYLFIILLAFIVNLCLKAVGALLINAMLVVPAATAANFGRNLRQMFWISVVLSVGAGIAGLWISNTVTLPIRGGELDFGPSGTIVVISVMVFFVSVARKSWTDRAPRPVPALAGAGATPENANNAREPEPTQPA